MIIRGKTPPPFEVILVSTALYRFLIEILWDFSQSFGKYQEIYAQLPIQPHDHLFHPTDANEVILVVSGR